MPEYRALRAKHFFLEMTHQPELVVEITQQPLRAFGFDAAILFSDILLIAEALGANLQFEDGLGPLINPSISSVRDISTLSASEIPHKMRFAKTAIEELKKILRVPLIGFCGAPFTVASYMIEGRSSKDLKKTKRWMFEDADGFKQLLDLITQATVDYLNLQIEAGVDAIQIFDTWANFLGYPQFQRYALAYYQKLMQGMKKNVPVILFCKGSGGYAHALAVLKPAGISLDWSCDMCAIRQQVGCKVALQGNLDPDVLLSSPATIQKEAGHLLQRMQGDPGYIFNLGHGITPDVPVDSVKTLVETIRRGNGS